MKNCLLGILLCGITLTAFAKDCQLGNVYEEIDCHKQEQKKLAKTITQQYETLQRLDNSGSVEKEFGQVHIMWQKFIETDCKLSAIPMYQAQGAGYALDYYTCITERHKQRIQQLEKMIMQF